ncbi:MAG: chorismate mutase [Chloroflexi bacterium]|jgi:chorismate mutase|nr:chorismate mutase [Chloroflexota bacterium]
MPEREELIAPPGGSPSDVDSSAPGRSDPVDPGTAALAPLRERIDAIDREIVALLNERAQIALEIGRVKQVAGRRAVRDARREEQVIEHVTSASAGLFPEPELVALYRRLIAATRRVQHAQRRGAAGQPDPAPGGRPRRPSAAEAGGGAAERAARAEQALLDEQAPPDHPSGPR